MDPKITRVVVTFEIELTDPTWTHEDLKDSAADYIEGILSEADRKLRARRSACDVGDPYRLVTDDLSVYSEEDYIADLDEINSMSLQWQDVLRQINSVPAAQRRLVWYLNVKESSG